ncbi:MAG: hypothetical protein QOF74_2756 [Caballeronia mineralivorans]|nr:hypothetical protein [Caballeronia mineralivorans]
MHACARCSLQGHRTLREVLMLSLKPCITIASELRCSPMSAENHIEGTVHCRGGKKVRSPRPERSKHSLSGEPTQRRADAFKAHELRLAGRKARRGPLAKSSVRSS